MRSLKTDFRSASVDAATRALLEYADKLAREPWTVSVADVDALRQHGFSDKDVTDAAHNVAFFAYINRMALGLGVELEPFMEQGGENVGPNDRLNADGALDPDADEGA